VDDNLAIFLVLTIAIGSAVIVTVLTSWIRAKYRHDAVASQGTVSVLKDENETLRAQVSRLEERLHVLERIATDPAERTAREIELLR